MTRRRHLMAKRAMDLILGSVLALLLALPTLVLSLMVAASHRCWPFFVQTRLGQSGRPFRMVKLRTLPGGTNPWLLKADLAEAIDESPRLVRFLRRRHLDELPQLALVLVGRMSLVGPRPKMPDDVEPAPPDYLRRRLGVPQGCSGLWQISRHSEGLPADSPEYDDFYIENGSLRMDLWILWRTASLMAGRGRRVELGDIPRWCGGASGWSTKGKSSNEAVVSTHEALR